MGGGEAGIPASAARSDYGLPFLHFIFCKTIVSRFVARGVHRFYPLRRNGLTSVENFVELVDNSLYSPLRSCIMVTCTASDLHAVMRFFTACGAAAPKPFSPLITLCRARSLQQAPQPPSKNPAYLCRGTLGFCWAAGAPAGESALYRALSGAKTVSERLPRRP